MYFRKEYQKWSALLTWQHGSSLVMLTLESKEIKPDNSKGNQPWMVIGRTDAEAPVLWLPNANSQFTGKDPDAGKDWGQEEKGVTEDEMVGWHHGLNGHEFEQTLGNREGQGSLMCCSPWGHRVRHDFATEQHVGTHITWPVKAEVFIVCLFQESSLGY